MLVVGPSDEQATAVSVRARGIQQNLGSLDLGAFVESITAEITSRGRVTVVSEHFAAAKV